MNKSPILIFLSVVALLVVSQSMFIVKEQKKGFILRFSQVLKGPDDKPLVKNPGLHFKIPFIDTVKKLDSRIQTFDGRADRITTSDKTDLIVDTYVKWRVKDFGQFYLRTQGSIPRANAFIDRFVDASTRAQFGTRSIEQLIYKDRDETIRAIMAEVATKTPEFGIEVVDVQVKKVNYPDEIREKVFQEMSSERKEFANANRAEGRKEEEKIRADTDAKEKIIIAEADRAARELRGQADAEAAKIYAETYNKNPEFYAFLRSLDAYKASFKDSGDIMVIKPDSEFFKYFKDAKGR
ncbi:protease modulator HflC [Kangiella sp. TOML190]|uniref:protease modulator HflC n=1 Tax=Kangiella sp. TOML190 TaxID=2931351 RepID=UPI00203F2F4A|nr:protease modulator HflC [Kangiella sp. TOML190]